MLTAHKHTRHSSDVVAALRQIINNDTAKIKEISIVADVEVKTDSKPYTLYLIHVEKTNERSWCVKKRYSEFDALYKMLSKKFPPHLVPQLPPKLVFGNFNQENISKRKKGLQQFLEGLSQRPDLMATSTVQQFLEVDKDKNNAMYRLPDSIYTHIFQYCTVKELFLVISLTCNWWRNILYRSVPTVDMTFVNKNIFFGNIPVNIDTIEQIVNLVKRYVILSLLF
jgi:hypothetical protein